MCDYDSNILNTTEDYILSAQVDSCQERADTSVRNQCLYDSVNCRTSWSLNKHKNQHCQSKHTN